MRYFIGLFILIFPLHVYAGTIPDVSFIIQSDDSWKASLREEGGWFLPTFNDDHWVQSVSPSIDVCLNGTHTIGSSPMWYPNSNSDTTVFFRKQFHVGGDVESAILEAAFSGIGEIYINGKRVESALSIKDVSSYLRFGTNTLAIKADSLLSTCKWAQVNFKLTISFGEILDVPLFIQHDPEWADNEYASGTNQDLWCGHTIEECGCAVSSLAMILRYHGVFTSPDGAPTTPKSVNEYFMKNNQCTQNGCSSLGYVYGNVRWNAVNNYSKEAYDMYGTPKVQFVSMNVFDKDEYDFSTQVGDPVILKTGDRSHWIVGHGYMSDGIWVRDPFYFRKRLTQNDPSYPVKSVAFTKVQSNFSLIEVFSQMRDVYIVDPSGKRTGMSSRGEITEEISHSFVHILEDVDSPVGKRGGGEVVWISVSAPFDGKYYVSKPKEAEIVVYAADKDAKTTKETVTKGRVGVLIDYSQSGNFRISMRELIEQNYCGLSS